MGTRFWRKEAGLSARRISAVGFIALLVLVLSVACTPVTPELQTDASTGQSDVTALTPVQLSVGFIPSVQFTSYYVAIDQGYFADEGLDVSLEYGFENDYLKLVGLGERDFMIGSGDQVILARAQDLPVRYVMNWYTRYPVVIFAKVESNINGPADLAGKRIGIPGPFGASYVALLGVLEAGGLTESDIAMESIGFTQAAALSQGTVDAAVDYAANGPVVLQQEGLEISTISLDPYLPMPSNGLITNETVLREQPEMVRAMVRASLRGVAYTLENPEEAFQIALKYVPEADGENRAINRAIFDATLDFWRVQGDQEPGATDAADWSVAAEFMARIGLVDKIIPAEELYTNEFLPE